VPDEDARDQGQDEAGRAEHLGHPPARTGGVRLFEQFVRISAIRSWIAFAWRCGKVDPEWLGYLLTGAF
jgi:hypothetical protein